MPNPSLDKFVTEIQSLPYGELLQLRRMLDQRLRETAQKPDLPMTPKFAGRTSPPKDRSQEREWLAQHRHEYAGQWIALDGDRLIAHDAEYEPVSQAVKAARATEALILLVEGSEAPPFIGL